MAQRYDADALDSGDVLIHSRSYDVASFRVDDSTIRLDGRIIDAKPAGLFVKGDSTALPVHDMTVSLTLRFPELEIAAIDVGFSEHPHHECPGITTAYQQLVGQSIAAGFSRFVNATFGRQAGCTHIGALLKAMAPVAIQSIYSMRQLPHVDGQALGAQEWTAEEKALSMAFTLNSCHVWDEHGDHARATMADEPTGAPVWIEKRHRELGSPELTANWEH